MRHYALLAAGAAILTPVTAIADPTPAAPDAPVISAQAAAPFTYTVNSAPVRNIYAGNFVVVGVGVANVVNFEGTRKRGLYPAAGFIGRYGRIGFRSRGVGVAFDGLKKPKNSRISFSLGPVFHWRGGVSRTKDAVLSKLGDPARGYLEGGVTSGIQLKHVLDTYDTLSFGMDVRWDITRGTGGRDISFGPTYFTPVSKAQVIGLSASADVVNDAYNSRYTITGSNSTASGLDPYNAHGGLKNVSVKAYTAYDLGGDLRNGGFAVGAAAGYTWLLGSAADSPIITLRGRHGGFMVAAGIGYGF
jgi:outer membrane scaffolding protein for murein synthesis (MipA/OmpV family)